MRLLFQYLSAIFLLYFFLTLPASAQTDEERAEQLFQEGLLLYQQHCRPCAFPKFEEAAALGHGEAAYYAGEAYRRGTVMTPTAVKFYRQAAESGEVYAMLRLSRSDAFCGTLRDCDPDEQKQWLEKAEEVALARAQAGDAEAMLELFFVYWQLGDRSAAVEWTQKAAEAGHRFAQYWLAVGIIDEGVGFYWFEENRREDVIKWLRASAENGFPRAMLKLAFALREKGELEEARYWVETMASTDYYHALLEAGAVIMFGPDIAKVYSAHTPDMLYGFEKPRPVEGAALLLAVHRQTGRKTPLNFIDRYREYLTPEILAAAEERSKELLVDTPVLYYDPKFGL